MRIGVFGGSFDPPHVGHLMVTSWLRWTDQVDEVWWLPVGAHAFGKQTAAFDARVALCARAIAELPWARVEPIEGGLPAPTYTVDTLAALAARHPEHALRLVVGADVLPATPRWKAWDEVARRFAPIVVGRAGFPTPPGAIDFPAVSSTEVRDRARRGAPIDHLVPRAILADVLRLYSGG